ncbi:ABC transporter ATP-binding protein [Muricoccus pecuniae]|uniref:Oligopeptide/dipeptide ABC transporter ATP-binding protein n=1 Tax=Muricoccus pecuniae TaxID=693023 RepID=A0A840Y5B2_9PROT|nr:oligopeptide/dipeptide ABC transporter ATP-binding protein [Roseomonas pecuniae]MBB5696318.1 oligopeptide/dipeptide ABC transporter ATP-binding protein [Roseomonas pecuniae]
MPDAALLETRGLKRHFAVRGLLNRRIGTLRALDGVDLAVEAGEVLGIVGESGCGKSTLGKTIMGIHQPTEGEVRFAGVRVAAPGHPRPKSLRARLQYVYQDPGASLDPSWTLRRSMHEPLVIHTDLSRGQREERIREIIAAVGLPVTHLDLYPHEISGGQQRRIGLARILCLGPRLVILDEPTSGLDVSVQAAVLALFRELRERFGLTYLFISHDLAVVRSMCDRVAVMYLGRVVEIAPAAELFAAPRHPYTRALLAAAPRIGGPRVTENFTLQGEPPDPSEIPAGCRFRGRCPLAAPVCAEEPALDFTGPHGAACWRWREAARLPSAASSS